MTGRPHRGTAPGSLRLEGRVAVVTGGGRGIGEAISHRFAEQGARVLIATRTAEHGQRTVDAIRSAGHQAELIAVELGTREASRQIVQHAESLWGALDIVVHNAASLSHSTILSMPDEEMQRGVAVGPSTAVWLMQDAHHLLKASGRGRVIFTSTIAADRNFLPGLGSYAAVKAAMNALAKVAAVELGPDGITVNVVAPGSTRSASFEAAVSDERIAAWEQEMPLRRIGTGDDIANMMLFLASDDASYVTGQVIAVDGGQVLGKPYR